MLRSDDTPPADRNEFPQGYHLAWLEAHPARSLAWLERQIADGFVIHHLDGDHDNDEPHNLVLIESVDHIRLHAGKLGAGIEAWKRRPKKAKAAPAIKHVFPTARHHRENRQFDWDRMHFADRKLIVGTT